MRWLKRTGLPDSDLNGEWNDDWRNRTVTVATNNYVGTSDDVFDGMHNPLGRFNDTPKLVEQDVLDVDGAIAVLTAEAAGNDGLLTIDTAPHFIKGAYQGAFPDTEPTDRTEPSAEPDDPQPGSRLPRVLQRIVDFILRLIRMLKPGTGNC